MNFVSLITHGLSSIAVCGDVVGTRILLFITILLISLTCLLAIALFIRFFTNLAIPGWTTYVVGLLFVSACQLILVGTVFSLMVLASRNSTSIIPIKDYSIYIDYKKTLTSKT